MTCKECNKEVENIIAPETLQDKQCFACGSFLTEEEIDSLKAQLNG